jgi:hypothetical protein
LSIQLGNDGQSAMPSLEENDWATAKNCLLILEPLINKRFIIFWDPSLINCLN